MITRNGEDSVKKQYVRYRLILESNATKQPTGTTGGGSIKDHPFMAVGKEMRQNTLSDEEAIKMFKKAGKVISSSVTTASKIAYDVLKKLGVPIGKWIITELDYARGTLRGALKNFTSWVAELVKNLWKVAGKGFSDMWTGFASMCTALIPSFKNAITKMFNKKINDAYVASFRLSSRTIKILSESANNNPGVIRRILNKVIEKAKAACRDLYNLCVKNNIDKKNPKLAGKVGISTILICGHPGSSTQPANSQNGVAVGAN